jgi:hypothetical protein
MNKDMALSIVARAYANLYGPASKAERAQRRQAYKMAVDLAKKVAPNAELKLVDPEAAAIERIENEKKAC